MLTACVREKHNLIFFAVSMDTNTAESDISSSHCPDRLHGMCPRQNETPKIHLWDLHMITSLCLQPYVLGALISLWERDSGRESLQGNHLLSRKPSWHKHAGVGFINGTETLFSDSFPGLVSCADRAVGHSDCHCRSAEPLWSVSHASFTPCSWDSAVLFHLSVLISPFLLKKPWCDCIYYAITTTTTSAVVGFTSLASDFWHTHWICEHNWDFNAPPNKSNIVDTLTQQLLVCVGVC